tara:strand:+ start:42 stop:1649 length:1608 start_codon:yes stop_codon:yes gene_type:complete
MKVLAAETNLGSATNISNAPVVRLFNSGTDNILVTRKDYNAVVVGSFIVPAGQVVYCEKYFTDTLEGSADVKATKVAYSSMMSFASSGSSGPTYTYSVSASSVDEGGNWTTTVTTTNVDDNTTLYWSLSGTGITSADFSSGALTGSGTISNNTFNFSHTVAADTLTEGTETVDIKLFTDSGRNTQVGNTISVTLNDTSLTATYSISANVTAADEGDTITTTITTTNIANGTELFWELSGTGIAAGDFSSGALTGSGTISSNTFNFSHTIAEDNATEGTETLNIKFYSDSGRTTQVGSTISCTINDTSVAAATKSVEYDGNDAVIFGMNSSSLDWGASESATFECWFKINAYTGSWNALFGRWKGGEYGFLMEIANDGKPFFAIGNGSGYYANMEGSAGDVSAGTWYHIAAVKTGTTGAMYLNGTSVATTNSWNQSHSNSTRDIVLGGNADSYTAYGLDGYLTDVRFTVGQALYSGNFTPNTSPLTTTSQGAVASAVKFLGSQSTTTTAATKVLNGSSSDTATTFGDPSVSTENPY